MYDILERGEEFLCKKRPLVLGISPGNSYYYKNENLVNLLNFAENNSDKVLEWRLLLTGGIIMTQTIISFLTKSKALLPSLINIQDTLPMYFFHTLGTPL